MNELAGLSVLIFRAPRTDDPLSAGLTAKGASVHSLPVQKIIEYSEPRCLADNLGSQKQGAGDYHKAIFVSRRAALLALSTFGKAREAVKATSQCFAVGPTTASVLKDQGFAVGYPDKGSNSEGLLALAELQQVDGEHIIIFRGRGGRELLGQTLRERGARVDYCELYQRQLDVSNRQKIIDQLQSDTRSVLLAHSVEILLGILALLGSEHKHLVLDSPLVVPGERLAERGRALGFKQLIVANSALADALVRALLDWYTQA